MICFDLIQCRRKWSMTNFLTKADNMVSGICSFSLNNKSFTEWRAAWMMTKRFCSKLDALWPEQRTSFGVFVRWQAVRAIGVHVLVWEWYAGPDYASRDTKTLKPFGTNRERILQPGLSAYAPWRLTIKLVMGIESVSTFYMVNVLLRQSRGSWLLTTAIIKTPQTEVWCTSNA